MNEPRLHLLAKRAAAAIALGHEPIDAVLMVLVEATARPDIHPFYDRLPPRYRSICRAMWGEPPLGPKAIHRVIGGSRGSVGQMLIRLRRIGIVRRAAVGQYTLVPPSSLSRRTISTSVIKELRARGFPDGYRKSTSPCASP